MTNQEKIIHARLIALQKTYFTDLNKNNITIRFRDYAISIRSSILRIVLWTDILITSSFFSILFRDNSEPYRLPLTILIIYFLYALWEDLKSINNIKIDVRELTLSISYLNPVRQLASMITGGSRKKKYLLSDIESFVLAEKDNVKVIFTKNYIRMRLKNEKEYILFDVPDKKQCLSLNHLLNDILHLKFYLNKGSLLFDS